MYSISAPVERGSTLVTMVTRDTSRMLTLFVLVRSANHSQVGRSLRIGWLHDVTVNRIEHT